MSFLSKNKHTSVKFYKTYINPCVVSTVVLL
jgi:hypothetical protein